MKRLIFLFFLGTSFIFGQEKPLVIDLALGKTDSFFYFSIPDTNRIAYSVKSSFSKPEKWLAAEKKRKTSEFYSGAYPETFSLENALAIIDTAKEFHSVCAAKSWCVKNYELAFPHLVSRLSVKQKIGLQNSADLMIGNRLATGELQFYGHGGSLKEDLLTIAGRASWILNEITGEDFAIVRGNMTEETAAKFKILWMSYLSPDKQ